MNASRAVTLDSVSPTSVRAILREGRELALLDVRPEVPYAAGHPLFAASAPLDTLELGLYDRLPRLTVPVVVYGDGDDATIAARRLRSYGYRSVALLDGGLDGWVASGGELFSGVNVASKAFGELVADTLDTPSVAPQELHRLLGDGADVVVLDARREDEYRTMSIPTAVSVPGAGLVRHVAADGDDPARLVVVNCAGRTRSIIGAQSLVNAGVASRVAALRDGTIGWTLAGLALEHGQARRGAAAGGNGRGDGQAAARRVAERAGVTRIDSADLDELLAGERTVYRFDVRSPDDYRRGHPSGFTSAPGGQLVQETDRYAPVRGGVVVLVDDDGTEADMTASWLAQMGWDVSVLDGVVAADGTDTGTPPPRGPAAPDIAWRHSTDVAGAIASGRVRVVDVDLSTRYRAGHIPGAWWARRRDLLDPAPDTVARLVGTEVVVTSGHDALTAYAVTDLGAWLRAPVAGLRHGTDGWVRSGRPLETASGVHLSEPIDVHRRPYEGTDVDAATMRAYLEWEHGLVAQLARDGTHRFSVMRPPTPRPAPPADPRQEQH